MLKWAWEHGCPWVEITDENAASEGRLEVLKWARERDCPCDEVVAALAVKGVSSMM